MSNRLRLALLALVASAGCSSTGYYVSNVYRTGDQLYVERCALDAGKHGNQPDPQNCRIEPVGPIPADRHPAQ